MMRFKFIITLAALVSIKVACAAELTDLNAKLLERDERNSVVSFNFLTEGDVLTYCLKDVELSAGTADVFRIFLQGAEELKDETFSKVQLCYKDEVKFYISGDDFKTIGSEFEFQNPMYTVRTFPEKVMKPDGTPAFKKHQGGLLYLARVQMQDANEMHKQWYLQDILDQHAAKLDKQRPTEFADDEDVF